MHVLNRSVDRLNNNYILSNSKSSNLISSQNFDNKLLTSNSLNSNIRKKGLFSNNYADNVNISFNNRNLPNDTSYTDLVEEKKRNHKYLLSKNNNSSVFSNDKFYSSFNSTNFENKRTNLKSGGNDFLTRSLSEAHKGHILGNNSLLNSKTEEGYISYFKEMIELESELEAAKKDLIRKPDFNIQDAFLIFELSQRGSITQLDIKYGMNALDIFPSEEDICLLIQKYDTTGEGLL